MIARLRGLQLLKFFEQRGALPVEECGCATAPAVGKTEALNGKAPERLLRAAKNVFQLRALGVLLAHPGGPAPGRIGYPVQAARNKNFVLVATPP